MLHNELIAGCGQLSWDSQSLVSAVDVGSLRCMDSAVSTTGGAMSSTNYFDAGSPDFYHVTAPGDELLEAGSCGKLLAQRKVQWTDAEQFVLAKEHAMLGNKWSTISRSLPGRSENDIKNFWHATLRSKGVRRSRFLFTYVCLVRDKCHDASARVASFSQAQAICAAAPQLQQLHMGPDGLPATDMAYTRQQQPQHHSDHHQFVLLAQQQQQQQLLLQQQQQQQLLLHQHQQQLQQQRSGAHSLGYTAGPGAGTGSPCYHSAPLPLGLASTLEPDGATAALANATQPLPIAGRALSTPALPSGVLLCPASPLHTNTHQHQQRLLRQPHSGPFDGACTVQGLGAGAQPPPIADHVLYSQPQTRCLAPGGVHDVGQAPEGVSCPLPQQRTWPSAALEHVALSGPGPMEARWRAAGLAQQKEQQQGDSALEAFMLQQEQLEQQQERQRQLSLAQGNTGSRRLLSELWHQPPPSAVGAAGGLTLTRLEPPPPGVQPPPPPPAAPGRTTVDVDTDAILLGLKLGCVIGEPPGQLADAAAAAAAAGTAAARPSAETAGGGDAPLRVGSVCSSLTGPSMAMEVDDWWDSFSDGEQQHQQLRKQHEQEQLMLTGQSLPGKPSAAAVAATPVSGTGECTTTTASANVIAIANTATSTMAGSLDPAAAAAAALTTTWSSWDRFSAATCTTQHTALTLTLPSRPHSLQGYAPSAPWLTASAASTSGPCSAHNSPRPPRSAAAAGAAHNRRTLQGLALLPPAKVTAPRWRRTSAAAAVGGGVDGRLREMLAAPLPVTDAASTLGLDGGLLGELDSWLGRDGGGGGVACGGGGAGVMAGPSVAEAEADALFSELLLLPDMP